MMTRVFPILLGTSVLMNVILAFGIVALWHHRTSPGAIVYQSIQVHNGMDDLQAFRQNHRESALHDAAVKFLTVSGEYQQYAAATNDLSFEELSIIFSTLGMDSIENDVSNADMERLQSFLKYLPDNSSKMDEMKNNNKLFLSSIQNYLNELNKNKLIL
ncbi:hypothetical protein JI721_05975 [Alicyclobacillus cycloheptanicus]|uniref:Uncharacterized protein n=1 Tax=Alicyclobacillus cycloheptanicus TaxID=1457 RepID=A0ABT9XMD5_9BACL|nr:hypothetical protein [Alicyclobacillus cycloheptanicus]MDQ0191387.1 hypothetical protein [Alicyclobacillus cycloheptanicus]WDM02351.1 hypothetical protein JI721_05975 [Alicyclobacillus cycloheptanicus]